MLVPRVIPCLLLRGKKLVKTVRFRRPEYVGDPINTVRIFNEKEVDELVFLDIGARPASQAVQLELIAEIASECFMPFAYGGGLNSIEDIRHVLANGAEKVVLNTALHDGPAVVREAAERFGSQSIMASIDVRKTWRRQERVVTSCGQRRTREDPVAFARRAVELGAGEILLTSIDRDGTFQGYDLELTARVSQAVDVPVIACGGAGHLAHLQAAVTRGGADAVGAGSLFVYQNRNRSVLINYPRRHVLDSLFLSEGGAST